MLSCDLLIDETLGIVSLLHTASLSNLSLISQAKIEGHSVLYLHNKKYFRNKYEILSEINKNISEINKNISEIDKKNLERNKNISEINKKYFRN